MEKFEFLKAKPVWAEGKTEEINYSLLVRAVLPRENDAVLYITGQAAYRVFINGEFAAQGPARAGHGFYRVDELPLSSLLTGEENVLCVLCAGYNVNCFEYLDQPSFLCAEVRAGGKVICATGVEGDFGGAEYTARHRRVQRFSFQRAFTESYEFGPDHGRVLTDLSYFPAPAALVPAGEKNFLRRDTLQSDYERRPARCVCGTGKVVHLKDSTRTYRDRAYDGAGEDPIGGFRPGTLEIAVVNEIYGLPHTLLSSDIKPAEDLELPADGFAVYDMGLNTTGYICLDVTPEADCILYAVFNERLPSGGFPAPDSNSMASAVRWSLSGGRTYSLMSFEPYTYRCVEFLCVGAPAKISRVWQVCEHYPAEGLSEPPALPDAELREIWDAAVETFRQNSVDVFMDCPSRERAGWLCDSFFTSRAEYAVTGGSRIEKAFLENFLMTEHYPRIPDGMLPMCYPSDHYDGNYIPNWAMWYVLELAEYVKRSGDSALAAAARPRLEALAEFLARYENEYGLLEKLDGWVFVEWSRANDYIQDVNFPTNMLYARFLETLGGLFGNDEFAAKAGRVKESILSLGFDGSFFLDNALRTEGELVPTKNHTETAQYYAFFMGIASPGSHPVLWDLLLTGFGPSRDPETQYPGVPVSNAFIGNFLRLDLLYRYGEYERLTEEIRSFFLPMARATGTLWEHMSDQASCCHGFASCVAHWLRIMYGKTENNGA